MNFKNPLDSTTIQRLAVVAIMFLANQFGVELTETVVDDVITQLGVVGGIIYAAKGRMNADTPLSFNAPRKKKKK